jgi:hypothetical protein
MTEHRDYESIDVPEHKHPEDYTCGEKRAEIVRLWKESNDPKSEISPTKLAERYGHVKSTLHDDIEIVKEYLREQIGEDDELKSDLGFDRSIRNLEQQGEWYKAAQVRKMKWDWLQEAGHKDKEPDKLEHEHSGDGGGPMNVAVVREAYSGDSEDTGTETENDGNE